MRNTVGKMVATVNFSSPENHFDSGRLSEIVCRHVCNYWKMGNGSRREKIRWQKVF